MVTYADNQITDS